MQKFTQNFITERAIHNKVIQLFGRRQNVESKKSELDICEILLQQEFTHDQQLAKDLQRRPEAKPPITLYEVLSTLVETDELKKVLVKVQPQSEDQAVLSRRTKRTAVENNLSKMQQLSRSVQYVQRTTMLLNVQNLMRD
jgi:hypothetical protein